MFKELFVVLKAQFSGFINGVKNLLGVTQGAAKKVNEAAAQMEGALTSAFSSQLRNNVTNLSEQISLTKEAIVNAKQELVQLQAQLKKQKEGTKEFKETQKAIKQTQGNLKELNIELAEYNIQARDQKKALADSRLAAEDNSAAIEATSRAVNAATGAILLLGEGNESLKPLLKGVSVAMAGINAVIAIQNLRLRENAVFLSITTKAQNALKAAVASSTVVLTAFKAALLATVGGAVIAGLAALYQAAVDYNRELDSSIDKELELAKIREKDGLNAIKVSEKAFREATEIKILENKKAGKSDQELANIEIDLLKQRQNQLRVFAAANGITQAERAKALEMYNSISNEIYKKELNRDIELIESGKKVAKVQKEKVVKADLTQIVNDQQNLALKEIEINKQRALTLATTEEKRAQIINDAELESFNVRQSGLLQQINIQKVTGNKALELIKDLELERIKIAVDGVNRLQAARDKDTDNTLKSLETQDTATKEANLGLLKMREEYYRIFQGINAKQFNDNEISEKQYIQNQKELTVDWLKEKIRLQKDAGVDTLQTEKELAAALLALDKTNKEKLTLQQVQFAKRTSQVFQQAFTKLGQDIATALNESLQRAFQGTTETAALEIDILKAQQKDLEESMKDATKSQLQMLQERKQYLENEQKLAEATESNLSKLFKGILGGVADFLQQLGIGLIAAALATEAFQKTLLTQPLAAAAAGAAAIVAAAGVRAVLARGVAFADGGIVSGPTLGLVGEYPGASTNPEVIAPLNKLKSLIGDTGGSDNGFIAETRISGRDLAIVLNRYNKDLQRG
jgi:hypothetical protein